jgi:hypothetical protein
MLTYGSVAALATWAAQKREEGRMFKASTDLADQGLLAGASVLASCSAVLMYVKRQIYIQNKGRL